MKHKSPIFLWTILALFISCPLHSQNYALDWAKSFNGDDQFEMTNAAFDNGGNVIAVGTFNGTVDFDPGPGISNLTSTGTEAFVTKLSPLGNLMWAKKFDIYSSKLTIAVDNAGDISLTGAFWNTVDFDPGPSVFNLSSTGGSDGFILKLSATGNFMWVKQIGGNGYDNARDILTDGSGNLFITGSFRQTIDLDPGPGISNFNENQGSGFLIKLDASGIYQWAKQLGDTSGVYPEHLFFDQDKNLIISGNFYENTDFDPGVGSALLSTGIYGGNFLLKLTNSGNFRWVKGFGDGAYEDNIEDIVVDYQGNIFMVGYYDGSIDMDPGPNVYNFTATFSSNLFACELDSLGNFQWAISVGQGRVEGLAIASDTAGNLYLGGRLYGTSDFDPGPAVFNLSSNTSGSSFLLKINNNGQFLWANNFGSEYTSALNDIVIASNGDMLMAGSYNSFWGGNFNPWYGNHHMSFQNGNLSGYLLKSSYCQAITVNTSTVSCDSVISPNGNQVWYASGVYTDTLTAFSGCDSIVVVNLTINQSTSIHDTVNACQSFTWPFSGQKYYTSGTYTESHITPAGCDSSGVLYLTISQPSSGSMTVNACDSYTWPANNTTYYASGGFTIVIPNHNGCDSLLSLYLTITSINDSVTLTNNSLIANQKYADSYQWLNCDNNYALIPQATSRVLQDTSGGFFAVIISKKNCIDTSACYSIKSLDMQTWTSQVKVYPNPTRGRVFIELPPTAGETSFSLFSAHGELIYKSEKNAKDNKWVIELPTTGFYLLSLKTENAQRIYKLLRY